MEITKNKLSTTPTSLYERFGICIKWSTKKDSYGFGFSFCNSKLDRIENEHSWFRIWFWNISFVFHY